MQMDTLAASALAIDNSSLPCIAKAKAAVERLVFEPGYLQRGQPQRPEASGRSDPLRWSGNTKPTAGFRTT